MLYSMQHAIRSVDICCMYVQNEFIAGRPNSMTVADAAVSIRSSELHVEGGGERGGGEENARCSIEKQ